VQCITYMACKQLGTVFVHLALFVYLNTILLPSLEPWSHLRPLVRARPCEAAHSPVP
jgi:hypothetical protein